MAHFARAFTPFLATSDIHMEHKLRMSRDDVLETVGDMVQYARSLCPNVEFSPEDAGRSDPEFLVKILEVAIKAGRYHAEHTGHGGLHNARRVWSLDQAAA